MQSRILMEPLQNSDSTKGKAMRAKRAKTFCLPCPLCPHCPFFSAVDEAARIVQRFLMLSALLAVALLSACAIDTTGISAASSRGPHPKTNQNAPVTVTEFGDLQCPACRAAKPLVEQIIATYGTQITFEFKHFPLQAIHAYAMADAEASECAADQGKFWEYVELAYEKQPDLNNQAIRTWAQSLNLDMDLFDRCTKSHIKEKEILADYDKGSKLGARGTPTFFVNGQKVESTIESISVAIDAALSSLKDMPL